MGPPVGSYTPLSVPLKSRLSMTKLSEKAGSPDFYPHWSLPVDIGVSWLGEPTGQQLKPLVAGQPDVTGQDHKCRSRLEVSAGNRLSIADQLRDVCSHF